MKDAASFLGRGLACAALALALAMPLAHARATAHPLAAFSFRGQGNVLVFDAAVGSGGWNGEILEVGGGAAPLSFAALVTFDFDAAANRLRGRFEFTQADDLDSTIFGRLRGGFTDASASLASGGQLGLDYRVLGGTGRYAGTRGFGLSFLEFDPAATGRDNYREDGLLVAVPEPGMAALMTAGLLLLLARLRQPTRRSGQARLP